ncbi:MAG: hypothetical protein AAFZ15_20855 [Bacteroidota bacterium]
MNAKTLQPNAIAIRKKEAVESCPDNGRNNISPNAYPKIVM